MENHHHHLMVTRDNIIIQEGQHCDDHLGALISAATTQRRLSVISSHLSQQHSLSQQVLNSLSTASQSFSYNNNSEEDNKVRRIDDDEKQCVFCTIVVGDSPAFKLYEDNICLCILDAKPLSVGHSLIIPKSHFSSLEATPPSLQVVAAMCSVVPTLSNAIMKATHCDSFNLLVNSGASAGQVIFHTHLHIIPRRAHDQLWKSETFRRRPLKSDGDTALLADSIRGQLAHLIDKPDLVTEK
ncbi:adenylylsulfatase HINT3 isoform X1 [Amborella trichopoda]|uniref:adenylylsulfatase HINT3 isoform X1 n=1 Tax=Amborella trichopoda TaxID=13333 RepID=UPI0009BEECCA|nr:adenylylsulfatase HINT3 isoform X1 [Amborella trichopoda]XP_020518861.1 adenylylsulfatase HINT3 isoform X1 [Amborella trichopoda]|eukprot:XP_020518860.1 adenylylsulfatase HINT3 isoform X1 [Amborella trichopoda]